MNYEITQHAADAIIEREISSHWIEATLLNPELVEKDLDNVEIEHHYRRIEENGNRVFRVVLNIRANPIRIITVYFDRSKKGLL